MLQLTPMPAAGTPLPAIPGRHAHRRNLRRFANAAALTATVTLVFLSTLGVLVVAGVGIGFTMLDVPRTTLMALVALAGLGAVAVSSWLGVVVWRYEWREAGEA